MIRLRGAVGWIFALALLPATVAAQTPRPSFGKDVAPILYEKCAMCHRAGEVAPMSLMSYEEARPWAGAIKRKVVSRTMPPWHAEGEQGKWRNDRRLSQAEIDKIVAWVDAGAPRGSDAVPAPPQLALGWNHPSGRPPDFVIEAPELKVPAEGESPWQFVYVKLPFEGDVWVEASQVVPGNRAVVHHVKAMPSTLAPGTVLDAEGRVVPQGVSPGPGGGRGSNPRPAQAVSTLPPGVGGFSADWEPGLDSAVIYGPGVAERLVGTHLMFNLHYQANGRATTDKTRVGIWLQKGPVTHASGGGGLGGTFLVNGEELTGRFTAMVTQDITTGMRTVPNIPAGEGNYRLTSLQPIRQEQVLYSIQPHMHLRGRSMKYTVVYPDGKEQELLNVPHYDFNWQIVYEFAQPVTLPEGAVVRVEAVWDNSNKNKYNPRPDQEVFWGEQSWDEMFAPIMRTVVKLPTVITPAPIVQISQR